MHGYNILTSIQGWTWKIVREITEGKNTQKKV